jgi:hypothetical protein
MGVLGAMRLLPIGWLRTRNPQASVPSRSGGGSGAKIKREMRTKAAKNPRRSSIAVAMAALTSHRPDEGYLNIVLIACQNDRPSRC